MKVTVYQFDLFGDRFLIETCKQNRQHKADKKGILVFFFDESLPDSDGYNKQNNNKVKLK